MAIIVGVRFENAGKLYYFDPLETGASAGDTVIVETARGQEMGEAVTGPTDVPEEEIVPPLRPVLRVATQEDIDHKAENKAREKNAFDVCKQKIAEHQLPMKLVSCEYTFDNRMMGGLGICGRPLCCARFLGDFHPVSIKMAKEQNLSLNPTKISGACGRLMCCLQYEEEFYEKTSRALPRVGKPVHTPDGDGVVAEVNILKESVRVRITKSNDMTELKDYPADQVQRITGVQPQPAAADTDEDAPDPQIMHALKASEMDVPDDDADAALPPDDSTETAEEQPEQRRKPAPRPQQRQGRPPRKPADAATDNAEAAPQRPPRPPRPRRNPDSAPQQAPKAAPQPASEKPAAQKRDPWVVPEEFRQKRN